MNYKHLVKPDGPFSSGCPKDLQLFIVFFLEVQNIWCQASHAYMGEASSCKIFWELPGVVRKQVKEKWLRLWPTRRPISNFFSPQWAPRNTSAYTMLGNHSLSILSSHHDREGQGSSEPPCTVWSGIIQAVISHFLCTCREPCLNEISVTTTCLFWQRNQWNTS